MTNESIMNYLLSYLEEKGINKEDLEYLFNLGEFTKEYDEQIFEKDYITDSKKLEKGILTCYEAGTETMDYYMYKNKVDFIDWFGDYDDWSCTIEEFTRALLGKKKFLEMPRDINSYLEVEINDL